MGKRGYKFLASEDVYEIHKDGEYYGTVKVKAGAQTPKILERVHRVFPKLIHQTLNVDFTLEFIHQVTRPVSIGIYYHNRNKE